MEHKAKLFKSGQSQAVRLTKKFSFNSDHVYIRRDERSGNVILFEVNADNSSHRWDKFFSLHQEYDHADAFDYGQESKQPVFYRNPVDGSLKGSSRHEGDA